MKLSEVFTQKREQIIKDWMAQVRRDVAIASAQNLTYEGILDSLPKLMDAIARLLSRPATEETRLLLQQGIDHGEVRAQQGYDAEEIVREYAILREVIFDALAPELLSSEPAVLLRTIRLIDGTFDKAIAFCLKHYTEERLQAVNLLYDEMLANNQELDRMVRSEQTNMAHLAHELKSPLSSIMGYSDLFLRRYSQSGQVYPEYVEQALTGGRRLLEMINETLEMSSYQAGKMQVSLAPVQVCQVVEEVTAVLETLSQQKGLTLSVTCEPIEQPITTDRKRLRQIITNLISNAIRYTESGSILVVVRRGRTQLSPAEPWIEKPWIEIEVIDTGLGIDVAEQSRIFEPFYQGKAGKQLPSSTGLGLAITHQMVKLLQGSIRLRSEPNVGSTFTITLPLCYQSSAPQRPAQIIPLPGDIHEVTAAHRL
ncbi:MAG: sensor histidine kinase [Phormidesmis sp.]